MLDVAGLIRAAREKQGLAQKALADAFDVWPSVVLEWERGTRPVPAKHIAKLAALLELDPWLIEVENGNIPVALEGVDPTLIVAALKPLAKGGRSRGGPKV